MASPQVADAETAYNIKSKGGNIEKTVATSDKRWSYSLGVGRGAYSYST